MDQEKFKGDARPLKYFPYTHYARDVSLQQSNSLSKNIAEGKKYFSGRRKLYCYKVETSVLPLKRRIGGTAHFPGSVSGLVVFRKKTQLSCIRLEKGCKRLGYF